jgi:hypothetical protein
LTYQPTYGNRWKNAKIRALGPAAKLAFEYLISNPDSTASGIYNLDLGAMALDLSGPDKEIDRAEALGMLEELATIHERLQTSQKRAPLIMFDGVSAVWVVGQWKQAINHSQKARAKLGNEFLRSSQLPFWPLFFEKYNTLPEELRTSKRFPRQREFDSLLTTLSSRDPIEKWPAEKLRNPCGESSATSAENVAATKAGDSARLTGGLSGEKSTTSHPVAETNANKQDKPSADLAENAAITERNRQTEGSYIGPSNYVAPFLSGGVGRAAAAGGSPGSTAPEPPTAENLDQPLVDGTLENHLDTLRTIASQPSTPDLNLDLDAPLKDTPTDHPKALICPEVSAVVFEECAEIIKEPSKRQLEKEKLRGQILETPLGGLDLNRLRKLTGVLTRAKLDRIITREELEERIPQVKAAMIEIEKTHEEENDDRNAKT